MLPTYALLCTSMRIAFSPTIPTKQFKAFHHFHHLISELLQGRIAANNTDPQQSLSAPEKKVMETGINDR